MRKPAPHPPGSGVWFRPSCHFDDRLLRQSRDTEKHREKSGKRIRLSVSCFAIGGLADYAPLEHRHRAEQLVTRLTKGTTLWSIDHFIKNIGATHCGQVMQKDREIGRASCR